MDKKALIIIGAGGHAKVLLDILLAQKADILGLTDADTASPGVGRHVLGVPVLGGDSQVPEHSPEDIRLVNALGSVGRIGKRREIFQHFKALGYSFASVFHPAAIISRLTELGEGVQLMAGVVVQAGVVLGDNVLVNTRASVDHDCRIGAHAHLAPGAILSGGVTLGEGVHVGTGAVIIQGITVGEGSVIGAGAVVIRDVPSGVTVAGNPARVSNAVQGCRTGNS
ncbi:putative acetyltransferase EpsM [Peptococcaceae bacterium CEB3]|nr:putative acetyltransferase EpsM [Peptococcaceae bacterium CEB3]